MPFNRKILIIQSIFGSPFFSSSTNELNMSSIVCSSSVLRFEFHFSNVEMIGWKGDSKTRGRVLKITRMAIRIKGACCAALREAHTLGASCKVNLCLASALNVG